MVILETVDGQNLQKEFQYLKIFKKTEFPDISLKIIQIIMIGEKEISINKIESPGMIPGSIEEMDVDRDQGLDLHLDKNFIPDLKVLQEKEKDEL